MPALNVQLAKLYERHELNRSEASVAGDVFRPWFEELKERVPVP